MSFVGSNIKMINYLILKDNYNSFEQYYLTNLGEIVESSYYYNSSTIFRKIFSHYGIAGEHFFYGEWKNNLKKYNCIIVFDSIHTSKLLHYIHKNSNARVIYWHWNPIKTEKEKRIINSTKDLCEHWTFNPIDAERFGMKLNSQFFFYQTDIPKKKNNTAFFVGTDKGRSNQLLSLAVSLEKYGVKPDFHIIDQEKTGRFFQKDYVDYDEVINHLRNTRFAVEICQEGQTGLTARALEAMFFGTKLITNNKFIKNCEFYKKANIYIIGEDNDFEKFLSKPFEQIEREKLYPYSAEGWIERFMRG